MAAGPDAVPLRARVRPVGHRDEQVRISSVANPGMPDPIPGGDVPSQLPPRPFPGERPLGSDEPSAPFEEPPEPGMHPDCPAEGPIEPGIRA